MALAVAAAEPPARPQQLTAAFLDTILRPLTPGRRVASFEWTPMEVGVISEVVAITVRLSDSGGANDGSETRHFVGKFLRPEFPFERMFAVESAFYERVLPASSKFPFATPEPVFLSKVLIVLERVERVETFACVDGCPADKVPRMVHKLAQMHARFWDTDGEGLAAPAGIGSELSADAKQTQFPDCWASFLADVPLATADRASVAALCRRLSAEPERLARVHQLVADGPATLIHGDFHVANTLFAADGASDQVWLLDWATCGRGNPMRDLAFFFIVSVTPEERRAQEAAALESYFHTMTTEGRVQLSMADWTRLYRVCLLNQFLILVVYDNLSKHLASSAKTEKLRMELHAHFREVNVRACLAVLENFEADGGLLDEL